MIENIAVKASGNSTKNLIYRNNIPKDSIEYVIECSEEACGDMNQRGGGNFAKAIARLRVLQVLRVQIRRFLRGSCTCTYKYCAMVKSGTYKSVAIVAGGATAKLGMNCRDHKQGYTNIRRLFRWFCDIG